EAPPAEVAVAVPGPAGAFAEAGLQYQFRSESNGGQVTYRVVQVTEAPLDAPEAVGVVSSFAGTPQVLQNPFSNGGSPGEGGAEPRLTWAGEGAVAVQADPALAQAGGQFYVMMAPQEVLQAGGGAPRGLAPHGHAYSPKLEGPRVPRDERRRAQHNEGEGHTWSKGGILSKACDYVRELRQSNQRLQETFKEAEPPPVDNDLLRQQPQVTPVSPLEPKAPGPVGDGQVTPAGGPAEAVPPHLALTWARRRRHSPHFPLCSFCCGCCRNRGCGLCCRT
uniref:upstream stimulatory factor 2-like n=1 Tax=Lonchura striata TaxID=40157 RepID=UPI000B4C4022